MYQYDYALKYLERKYPSHTFEITGCSPKGMGIDYSTFWFRADGEEDDMEHEVYDLYLEEDDERNYSCEDNYYDRLLRDSYSKALLEFLQESVPECVGAYGIYILSMNPCDTYSGDELRTYVRSDEDQTIILRTYFKQSN